jgi:hypothetical protein
MFAHLGIVLVFGAVIEGFMMEHGNADALCRLSTGAGVPLSRMVMPAGAGRCVHTGWPAGVRVRGELPPADGAAFSCQRRLLQFGDLRDGTGVLGENVLRR